MFPSRVYENVEMWNYEDFKCCEMSPPSGHVQTVTLIKQRLFWSGPVLMNEQRHRGVGKKGFFLIRHSYV